MLKDEKASKICGMNKELLKTDIKEMDGLHSIGEIKIFNKV